jgi:cytochrome c oxidase subunit 2
MGKLFAVVVTVIALVSAAIFALHVWWLPPDISTHGARIDRQLNETMVMAGILFVAAQVALAAFVWRFGAPRAGAPARPIKTFPGGATPIVVIATLLVGFEVLVLTFVGSKVWAGVYQTPAPAGALRIEVQAEQFAFYFGYAGPDGRFGGMHPDLMNDATQNFFGLDPANDTTARDDIVVASLVIPVDQPIELRLHAKDVSHSFYVPELRIQQDFVPGMVIPLHFTATKTGRYEIVCTQLCGLGHYNMKAYLEVKTQAEFEQWLKEQVPTS